MKNNPNINLSLASYPAYSPFRAMDAARSQKPIDPLFGNLSLGHVQVCPQNCIMIFNTDAALKLKHQYPGTQFRLHANVRVDGKHKPNADLSYYRMFTPYFKVLCEVSKALGASAYTLHAGVRHGRSSMQKMLSDRKRIEDMMEIPVGIEGHYPTPRNSYWMDTWEEYANLLKWNVPYALDLSHINILAAQSMVIEYELIKELLSSEKCIEVHVSHNNGKNDQHIPMDIENPPFWLPCLNSVHEDAVVFYEGNFKRTI